MPLTSSPSRNVLKKSRMAVIGSAPSSFPPDPQRGLHPDPEHDDPYQRHRYEDFPAEPHDLVVAVARERRAKPQEARDDEEELEEQPRRVRRAQHRPRLGKRREPAAQEHDRAERRDE